MRKEYYNIPQKDLDIYLVNCGYEDCIENFVSNPLIRQYYLLHHVTKGSGYYEVAGKKYHISIGDLFIIHPGELVTYYSPDIKDAWSFCWIGFAGSKAKEYLSLATSLGYCIKNVNWQFYTTVINCLQYAEDNSHTISQLRLNTYVLNCLSSIIKDNCCKSLRSDEHVSRALSYIEYNYTGHISTKDVCTFFNLDRTYFYRIFKKALGMSPEQYIMNYRIQKSLELLQHTKYSVTEISSYVGIGNVYYFSRLFRHIMSMSPSEYRKTFRDRTDN